MHHLRVVQRAQPLLQTGHLDVVGLIAILLQPSRIRRHERKPLDLAAAARCRRPADRAANSTRRNDVSAVIPWWRRLSSKVPIRSRSERSSSRSTSATERRSPLGNRSDWARHTPFSQIIVWPSQARSVVDSPSPAAA